MKFNKAQFPSFCLCYAGIVLSFVYLFSANYFIIFTLLIVVAVVRNRFYSLTLTYLLVCQVAGYQNVFKLSCRPLALTSYEAFFKKEVWN